MTINTDDHDQLLKLLSQAEGIANLLTQTTQGDECVINAAWAIGDLLTAARKIAEARA